MQLLITKSFQLFAGKKKKNGSFFFSTVLHIEMLMKTADLLVEINQKKKANGFVCCYYD
jgi:hypothetical protein